MTTADREMTAEERAEAVLERFPRAWLTGAALPSARHEITAAIRAAEQTAAAREREAIKAAAHEAGKQIKIKRLERMPGMDRVAVKLNSGLTYEEEKVAKRWAEELVAAAVRQRGGEAG